MTLFRKFGGGGLSVGIILLFAACGVGLLLLSEERNEKDHGTSKLPKSLVGKAIVTKKSGIGNLRTRDSRSSVAVEKTIQLS